jgi:hypothetical protein
MTQEEAITILNDMLEYDTESMTPDQYEATKISLKALRAAQPPLQATDGHQAGISAEESHQMAEITKEQLEEWAQCIYENCGEGDSFNDSLYSIVMEMRDTSGHYNAQQSVQWICASGRPVKIKVFVAQTTNANRWAA